MGPGRRLRGRRLGRPPAGSATCTWCRPPARGRPRQVSFLANAESNVGRPGRRTGRPCCSAAGSGPRTSQLARVDLKPRDADVPQRPVRRPVPRAAEPDDPHRSRAGRLAPASSSSRRGTRSTVRRVGSNRPSSRTSTRTSRCRLPNRRTRRRRSSRRRGRTRRSSPRRRRRGRASRSPCRRRGRPPPVTGRSRSRAPAGTRPSASTTWTSAQPPAGRRGRGRGGRQPRRQAGLGLRRLRSRRRPAERLPVPARPARGETPVARQLTARRTGGKSVPAVRRRTPPAAGPKPVLPRGRPRAVRPRPCQGDRAAAGPAPAAPTRPATWPCRPTMEVGFDRGQARPPSSRRGGTWPSTSTTRPCTAWTGRPSKRPVRAAAWPAPRTPADESAGSCR